MTNEKILFFDLEVNKETRQIKEFGAIFGNQHFTPFNVNGFQELLKEVQFLCGHNVISFDLQILEEQGIKKGLEGKSVIDTLFLSPLLFPRKTYHHLVKDYKLQTTFLNNPIEDSKLAQQLFVDEVKAFHELNKNLQLMYRSLLESQKEFKGFFRYWEALETRAGVTPQKVLSLKKLKDLIADVFEKKICSFPPLEELIQENPIELAYALSLINTDDKDSITPPWVLNQRCDINTVFHQLRFNRCNRKECNYCSENLNPKKALKAYFGYEDFRRFDGDTQVPLQETVVGKSLEDASLLTIFPTGGGKSLTFQLPAIMKAVAYRSLTVVISPLQSLMKDQVDVLKNRFGISDAATINSSLSPLERSEAIERVEQGGANILYISPESLRSKTILGLLKNRTIERFVIDEAHCFSSWGHDFRVDYLFVGDFIKTLSEYKGLTSPIPVSCFTATAKKAVIEDIQAYFYNKLGIKLELFSTPSTRKNLTYSVYEMPDEDHKNQQLISLIKENEQPKIVYVSTKKKTYEVANTLKGQGINAEPFNAGIESETKIDIQNRFMNNEIDVIVATTAFGMGVDKEDVSSVIHYDISGSLENYVQEAGRAGRKEDVDANCHILFNERDLDKHFELLNAHKLTQKEVGQIWQAIKRTKQKKFSKSALELAREAGWDTDIRDLETRVKTSIAALEKSGYLKRGQNAPKLYADSFLVKSIDEIRDKVEKSNRFTERTKITAMRIAQNLFTYREVRIDYLSDTLDLPKEEIHEILNLFIELKIIGNAMQLTAFVDAGSSKAGTAQKLEHFSFLEKTMAEIIFSENNNFNTFHLRAINAQLLESGVKAVPEDIKLILYYWNQSKKIERKRLDASLDKYEVSLKKDYTCFIKEINQRHSLCQEIIKALFSYRTDVNEGKIEFLLLKLKTDIERSNMLLENEPLNSYQKALLFLYEIKSIKLAEGLMIFYSPLQIERLEHNPAKSYTKEDYSQLKDYYKSKTEQIHIVGEYAKKILKNYNEAMDFLQDYFQLDYLDFIKRYFPNRKKELARPITEQKFKEVFINLSPEQLAVINDTKNEAILVAAGPGSGKTRVLVHKVASLLLMEDTKPEQFLMLTFSRPAAIDFKSRLYGLVHSLAYGVDIFTYHGYAFKLLGLIGNIEESGSILEKASNAIKSGEVSIMGKTVMVIDEYQDVSDDEFQFIEAIVNAIDNLKVIAVGDDDQNVYEFRGSSMKYIREFREKFQAKNHFFYKNYRSRANIVEFSNNFIEPAKNRIKAGSPIEADTKENGTIQLIKYTSENLIQPLVEYIINNSMPQKTGILTFSNEDTLLITTLLKQRDMNAQLISGSNDFTLKNLLEIRLFDNYLYNDARNGVWMIDKNKWEAAKERIEKEFSGTKNIDICMSVIQAFEKENSFYYTSNWNAFLNDISLDLFVPEKGNITVSTFHKAKGREYDNVLIMLGNSFRLTEETRRLLYVAITRAKKNLVIHTNQSFFDAAFPEKENISFDKKSYEPPNCLVKQMNLSDVRLSFFKGNKQKENIKKVKPGDKLSIFDNQPDIFHHKEYGEVCQFSKAYNEQLQLLIKKGYRVTDIEIDYLVVWKDKEENKEYRIVLPKLILYRKA
ncbi:MAG: RecQ family ATP-dependent DNA helicase [Nitrospinae bacterium]|nr:RecQ family ATP-dependent DNA helicase [Nitrospinota bacterium]